MYHSRFDRYGAVFGWMVPLWADGRIIDIGIRQPPRGLVHLHRKFVDSENDDEGPNANASEIVSFSHALWGLHLAPNSKTTSKRNKYWGERGYGGWLRFQPRLRCGTWKTPPSPLHPLINASIHVGFSPDQRGEKAGPVQDDRMAALLLPRLLFVCWKGGGRDEGMRPCCSGHASGGANKRTSLTRALLTKPPVQSGN